MERRASDPEALDDLFRLDHLTTRMRRHAEGLVILAGAAPSRAWSSPVRMVDVIRGAIAEVEDYARVSVATRSQAALAGSAVADVIHLLAELVENATTLSPPYTSVRVSGDAVASGFAIEVEDRGLGMSPQRLAELNERLASRPEFNPSDSEQLGLFVVSQLAHRHGIRVTLKASPYGGTSAIVLIPAHLVVTEEAFRAGLPGEQPAAIGTGRDSRPAANGNHLVPGQVGPGQAGPRPVRSGGIRGLSELTAARPPEAPGIRISGPLRPAEADIPAAAGRRQETGKAAGPTGPIALIAPMGLVAGPRTASAYRASTCSRRCGADRRPVRRRLCRTADRRRMLPVPRLPRPRRRRGRGPRRTSMRRPTRAPRRTQVRVPGPTRSSRRRSPDGAPPRPALPGLPTRMTPVAPPSDRDHGPAAVGAARPDRTAAARGGDGRDERPAPASQAGQPGAPAARQPAGPHLGGRGRLRGERADARGTPQDHGGAPARLAGGPIAADEHHGPG